MPGFVNRVWQKVGASFRNILSGAFVGRLLAWVLGILILAYLFDFISFPFWPFTTQGKIYVDSPEVYTRERLVNDRYDQDYWLRKRLEELDEPGKLHLLVGESRSYARAQVGPIETRQAEAAAPEQAEQDDGEAESAPQGQSNSTRDAGQAEGVGREPFRLPFEQEFRVASGIRDMIRQQVLENMLDDRHDLTGNSVYGLKFDTTVIPGKNTRQRAVVKVTLTVDDLFQDGKSQNKLANHFEPWIRSRVGQNGDNNNARFEAQEKYYLSWLKDLEKRLNNTEKSVYESMLTPAAGKCPADDAAGKRFMHRLARNTLNVVLGIPTEVFAKLHPIAGANSAAQPDRLTDSENIVLPEPWARFFTIERNRFEYSEQNHDRTESGNDSCPYRIGFRVNALEEQFILARLGQKAAHDDIIQLVKEECYLPAAESELVPIGGVTDTDATVSVTPCRFDLRVSNFEDTEPKYVLTYRHIERFAEAQTQRCENDSGADGCDYNTLLKISIPSGLFNFIERMSDRDAYAYAIFPKNDVVSVFAETSSQLAAMAPAAGMLDFARQLRESTTSSVLIGYGDGGAHSGPKLQPGGVYKDDGAIVFGWIVSARGVMQPTQKSQLALVSVPAWADSLNLEIEKGWIDRRGQPRFDARETFQLKIAVPPSLEVFDFIFREDARVTLGPTIRQSEMDRDIYLRAGREAKLLIPGSRLWRSATVTLGAQIANRIRVLPNMEGIIAEFDQLDLPSAAYRTEEKGGADPQCALQNKAFENFAARPVRLRVWTSEGVTRARPYVCVIYDRKEVTRSSG